MLIKVLCPMFVIFFQTVAQTMIKLGLSKPTIRLVIPFNAYIFLGCISIVLNFLVWMYYLQHENLTTATALTSLVYIAIPISAWLVLGEIVNLGMLIGFSFILLGVIVVSLNGPV